MAILEINLEKPALVEEYQYPARTTAESETPTEESAETDSSGGSKAKVLGLLGVLAGVGLLVWKLKTRGGSEQTDFEDFDDPEFDDEEFTSDEGGSKGKVAGLLGLVVGVGGLLVAVQKRRS
ncbi:hypothetical protein [Halorussus lipolyticus]|uniref:hypothetical protein n=1 Tax=Halorussus lipolyticus TaxID=3034024 RepID=UPI0023E7CD4D|nr:hypothetical protein [Halorussus sp. DT80]